MFGGCHVCVRSLLPCVLLSSSGRAAASPLRVAWHAPPCATEGEFRARLQRVLHKEPEQPAEDLALSVQIRGQASAGFQLVVRARQHGDALERVLEPKTCADALEAAAVVVALAVDPNAKAAATLSPEPARESPRKAGLTVRSALLGGVALRELPQAAPFFSADTGLDFRDFSASLEAFGSRRSARNWRPTRRAAAARSARSAVVLPPATYQFKTLAGSRPASPRKSARGRRRAAPCFIPKRSSSPG